MFYHFSQNNSGGSFIEDEILGLSNAVIIEADSATEANDIAINKGIYFDGCSDGVDCDCCGDRWYPVDEGEGKDEPMMFGKPAKEYLDDWFCEYGYIHYKNGVIEKFRTSKHGAK
jgi:hypothetical protein